MRATSLRTSPVAATLALLAVLAMLASASTAFASRYPPCSGQRCQIDPHLPCVCPNNTSIVTDCQNFFNDCYQGIPPQAATAEGELSEESFIAELEAEVPAPSTEAEPAAAR